MHVTVHSSIRVKFAVKSLSTGFGKVPQDRIDQNSDRFDKKNFRSCKIVNTFPFVETQVTQVDNLVHFLFLFLKNKHFRLCRLIDIFFFKIKTDV